MTTTTPAGTRRSGSSSTSSREAKGGPSPRLLRWRRRLFVLLGVVVALIAVSAWGDRTSTGSVDLVSEAGGPITRITVVNDAGPVRLSRLANRSSVDPLFADTDIVFDGPQLVHVDSSLLRGPMVESEVAGSEVVVRISCPTRFPCRSRVELVVPDGIAALIVAPNGPVQVDGFIGELTIFAGEQGVAMGPVDGSVRIVTEGDVAGHALDADNVDAASIGGAIDLDFATLPVSLAVRGSAEPVAVELPPRRIRLDVESTGETPTIDARTTERGDQVVVIRSDGPISVVNSPTN